MSEQESYTIDEAHLVFAKRIHGRVWELLETTDRLLAEDEEMIHAAHASLYHWLQIGMVQQHQRGLWLIARVYVALGRAAETLYYASRCLELTEQNRDSLEDFDIAFAYEGMARANALARDQEKARHYYQLAEQAGQTISDQEDRDIFVADLASGDWFGIL